MPQDVPSVVATADGPTVVYRSRNLYSPTRPRIACRRRVDALHIPDGSLVLVPSPVLGHGLDALLQKCGPRCGVFLVELEASLAQLALDSLPHAIIADPRVRLCFAHGLDNLEQFFPPELRGQFERVVVANLSSGHRLHADAYDTLHRWLQDEIRRAWQNRITTMHMGRLWFRNLFANLALFPFSRPINSITVRRPTLVVGAGPSLDGLLTELPAVRSQLFLLAVDTAVPVLAARDIAPDAVVAVEPQHANLADFVGINRRSTILLADLFSFPAVARLFPPRSRVFFSSRPLECRMMSRMTNASLLPSPIPPLGSVGVAAVFLTGRMCAGPVAFAGLDFAYSDDKTHARGAPFLSREIATRTRLHGDRIFPACIDRPRLTAPEKHGGTCKTDLVLLSYAEQLRGISHSRCSLYDLGAHGLHSGVSVLNNLDDFLALSTATRELESQAESRAAERQGAEASKAQQDCQTRVRCALGKELQLITDLERAIGTNESGSSSPSLDDLLAEADYLYADTGARPPFNEPALRRVLAAARFYRLHIQRALQRL